MSAYGGADVASNYYNSYGSQAPRAPRHTAHGSHSDGHSQAAASESRRPAHGSHSDGHSQAAAYESRRPQNGDWGNNASPISPSHRSPSHSDGQSNSQAAAYESRRPQNGDWGNNASPTSPSHSSPSHSDGQSNSRSAAYESRRPQNGDRGNNARSSQSQYPRSENTRTAANYRNNNSSQYNAHNQQSYAGGDAAATGTGSSYGRYGGSVSSGRPAAANPPTRSGPPSGSRAAQPPAKLELNLRIAGCDGTESRRLVEVDRRSSVFALKQKHFESELETGSKVRVHYMGRALGDFDMLTAIPNASVIQCYVAPPQAPTSGDNRDLSFRGKAEEEDSVDADVNRSFTVDGIYEEMAYLCSDALNSVGAQKAKGVTAGIACLWGIYFSCPEVFGDGGRIVLAVASIAGPFGMFVQGCLPGLSIPAQ